MPRPARPLPSASVILLDKDRGQGEPFGLYLLRRVDKSRFMPGRYVFPGGKLEPADSGPDPGDGLRQCALRELWEEAGVILATDLRAAAALDPSRREEVRLKVAQGRLDLTAGLARLNLAPAPAALTPFARWITPAARSQRFDATFYLALMPPGQKAASDLKETSQGLWLGPGQALTENQEGRVSLAPPQVRIMGELAGFPSLEALLTEAQSRDLSPVRPVLWSDGQRRIILLPWVPDHPLAAPRDPARPGRPCPAGQASRLVHDQGRWLPYSSP